MSDEAAESSSSQMKRQSSSTVGTGVAVGQTKTSSEQSSKMTCAWEAAWFPQSSTAFHVRTMLTDCVHEATSQLGGGGGVAEGHHHSRAVVGGLEASDARVGINASVARHSDIKNRGVGVGEGRGDASVGNSDDLVSAVAGVVRPR